jgi:hypothetical protein
MMIIFVTVATYDTCPKVGLTIQNIKMTCIFATNISLLVDNLAYCSGKSN